MARSLLQLLFMLTVPLCIVVYGLPSHLERRSNTLNFLNSTSIIDTFAQTQSNAASTGPGSTVEISGIVSGEITSSLGAESGAANGNPGISSIASQVNCSEYSTSSAEGGLTADALASGDCLMNIDNTASHNFNNADSKGEEATKHEIGIGGQVNTNGAQSGSSDNMQEGTIIQATINSPSGSAEAYQIVSGPQATSTFSGIMSQAPTAQDVHGTQEVLMTHTPEHTNIQSLVVPFGA